MTAVLVSALEWFEIVVIGYFVVTNGFVLVLLVVAALELGSTAAVVRLEQRWRLLGSELAPRVSVLAPAYDEDSPGRVEFVPQPVAWTQAPATTRVLGRQRNRWYRGLAEVLSRHRRCVGNARYGAMGLIALPAFVVIELLGPIIEALGLVGLAVGLAVGVLDVEFALAFFLAAYGFGLVLNAIALVLDEFGTRRYTRVRDRLVLAGWALVEGLGYRHLTVWWRLRGLVALLRRSSDWGRMERTGFGGEEDATMGSSEPPG